MRTTILAVFAMLIASLAQAQNSNDAPVDARRFAAAALAANAYEIAAAKIVLEKGKAQDARDYADAMLKDHPRAEKWLKEAAAAEGVPDSSDLTPAQEEKLRALRQSDATNFDQAYLSQQILAHEEAVALFSNYIDKGPAGPLRTLAEKLLPDLRTHLLRVQGLTSK